MRWKISHHGHDPRQIDLLADTRAHHYHRRRLPVFQRSLGGNSEASSTTAFIVPSQSVRW